ncbi:hypothetical protein TBLA_0A04900 [Henningerozyma blattae CBS 6284]|uniref:Uncharacterized protein n=1 Tax=Henningerozyma blattae (strain ATCC 34711 / CBS 6284 / DSM 70876 / NBRC 10599 / NRRL Y-10934 / UCD 77-7) TaxID=1071380 RepID=I2GVY1_HENB6|nr:hypothetical protein TBLA_0A04900 [Tetrapisispora blattae CBS 6284]CCH58283.1 hypothetical protein TBLA_0A04900 [Tetrapisispora blattae CBS 6284]
MDPTNNSMKVFDEEFNKLIGDCGIDWIQEEFSCLEDTITEEIPVVGPISMCDDNFSELSFDNTERDLCKDSYEITGDLEDSNDIDKSFKMDTSLLNDNCADITIDTLNITTESLSEDKNEQKEDAMQKPTSALSIQSQNCFINEMVSSNISHSDAFFIFNVLV